VASRPDPVRKKFGSQRDRSLKNALIHRILKEFPRIGGPRIGAICAEMILEVVHAHQPPREHLRHGQVVWMAISASDPPRRQAKATTELVSVVLDLSVPEDIEARMDYVPAAERHLRRAKRLCEQAHAQGALLSNSDLSELMSLDAGTLGQLLSAYESRTRKIVPRRATLHDVGTGLTHKRIICRKRYLEGKEPAQIARETYHSLDAVDRYLGQYDRVRHCRQQGMSTEHTAWVLGCSRALVEEYLDLDQELEEASR